MVMIIVARGIMGRMCSKGSKRRNRALNPQHQVCVCHKHCDEGRETAEPLHHHLHAW